ncbi:MAG: hypothetical protein EOO11_09090 [Chitinophagaceae bacterium]|nr:MAG: hypothetical protein EOO11_09090 [Chitinophagaceae bacterium]
MLFNSYGFLLFVPYMAFIPVYLLIFTIIIGYYAGIFIGNGAFLPQRPAAALRATLLSHQSRIREYERRAGVLMIPGGRLRT